MKKDANTICDKEKCKGEKRKRLKKTEITPGHHTPILNDSSSSTVNSRQLALKFIILLPLPTQDTFFFGKQGSCILLSVSEKLNLHSTSKYPSNKEDSSPHERII